MTQEPRVPVRPPVEPLSDLAHARIERNVLAALADDRGQAPTRAPAARGRRWWPAWIMAALAIGATIAIGLGRGTRGASSQASLPPTVDARQVPQRVATSQAESSVSFADAELRLAPWTTVLLIGDADRGPLVVLDQGAAHFSVAPRGQRPPLVVNAGAVTVTVIGTRFQVERIGDAGTVDVAEGLVDVSYRGQSTHVGAGARWSPADHAAPPAGARATAGSGAGIAGAVAPAAATATTEASAGSNALAPGAAVSSPRSAAPATRTAPATLSRADRFDRATSDEGAHPSRALAEYRALAQGSDPWAANATFASARLLHQRGELAAARRHALEYLRRFPRGPNASDARELIASIPTGAR